MAVEAKRMDNSMAPNARESFLGRIIDWIKGVLERIRAFYNDVRTEMRKVTTPSRKEVQATTVVVIITVFLFGAFFFIVDSVLGRAVQALFDKFGK